MMEKQVVKGYCREMLDVGVVAMVRWKPSERDAQVLVGLAVEMGGYGVVVAGIMSVQAGWIVGSERTRDSPVSCQSRLASQLCEPGMFFDLPWPAQTPPPTALEMPTPRPTAAATTRRAMTILAHILCLLVRLRKKAAPRLRW